MNFGMTIDQAIVTWLGFIITAAGIGTGVVSIMMRRHGRKRANP